MIQILQTILISITSVITGMVLEFQFHLYEKVLISTSRMLYKFLSHK